MAKVVQCARQCFLLYFPIFKNKKMFLGNECLRNDGCLQCCHVLFKISCIACLQCMTNICLDLPLMFYTYFLHLVLVATFFFFFYFYNIQKPCISKTCWIINFVAICILRILSHTIVQAEQEAILLSILARYSEGELSLVDFFSEFLSICISDSLVLINCCQCTSHLLLLSAFLSSMASNHFFMTP